MSMNLIPKNVFKGRNSDGSSFRVEEWDFATLSNIELFSGSILFIVGTVCSAFLSPLITLLNVWNIDGRIKLTYFIPIIISGILLLDCYHGFLLTTVLHLFFEENGMTYLVGFNIGAILVNVFLILFSSLAFGIIGKPFSGIAYEDYRYVEPATRERLETNFFRNKVIFLLFMVSLFLVGLFIAEIITSTHTGWLVRNIASQ